MSLFLAGQCFQLPALAASDQQKPLVVLIFDKNCKVWCANVRPVVAKLRDAYQDRVDFDELDVTRETLDAAKSKAKELKIGHALEDARSYVPLVMMFSANCKSFQELVGPERRCLRKDFERHPGKRELES